MSPKDSKIIKANPNATPYDLLTQFGLSQGGFDELNAINDEKVSNVLKASAPKLTARPTLGAQPVLQPFNHMGSEQAMLRAKGSHATGTLISRKIAEDKVRKYPNDYEIVQ